MIKESQLSKMLVLQASMNAKVNPDWLTANYPFLRANVVEGAEAMDHHGWKWWKKQEPDKTQFAIELVDIWHFTLSHMIVHHGDEAAAEILNKLRADYSNGIMFDGHYFSFAEMDTLSRVELLIGLSVSRRVSITLFQSLMLDAGMGWEDLYKTYVGKNVLNFFRQDHGYKEGTYIKMWHGREDNVWLADLHTQHLDDTPEELYARLEERYQQVVAAEQNQAA